MPDAMEQFRRPQVEHVYMGGTTIGCGQHPTTPKRHRWEPWKVVGTWADGSVRKHRHCRVCALTESK